MKKSMLAVLVISLSSIGYAADKECSDYLGNPLPSITLDATIQTGADSK